MTFNMVNSILNHAAPNSWEKEVDFKTKRFALFELNDGDIEYQSEINAFLNASTRVDVRALRRVQNPFQLGSFILRKQQKEFRNDYVTEETWYHPINRYDLDVALEYNMDVRRYTYKYPGQHDLAEKNPKFYKTPGEADGAFHCNEKTILICKVLCGSESQSGSITRNNSTEYMPTYVADL